MQIAQLSGQVELPSALGLSPPEIVGGSRLRLLTIFAYVPCARIVTARNFRGIRLAYSASEPFLLQPKPEQGFLSILLVTDRLCVFVHSLSSAYKDPHTLPSLSNMPTVQCVHFLETISTFSESLKHSESGEILLRHARSVWSLFAKPKVNLLHFEYANTLLSMQAHAPAS